MNEPKRCRHHECLRAKSYEASSLEIPSSLASTNWSNVYIGSCADSPSWNALIAPHRDYVCYILGAVTEVQHEHLFLKTQLFLQTLNVLFQNKHRGMQRYKKDRKSFNRHSVLRSTRLRVLEYTFSSPGHCISLKNPSLRLGTLKAPDIPGGHALATGRGHVLEAGLRLWAY